MAGEFDSEQSDKDSVTGGDRDRGRRPGKGRIVIRTIAGFARRAKTDVVSFCALAWPGPHSDRLWPLWLPVARPSWPCFHGLEARATRLLYERPRLDTTCGASA